MTFKYKMEARDHECDVQGVVNNAHYQHYFEHARHVFLKQNELDFAALARQHINLMVKKIEIEYLHSLSAHDQFYITVHVNKLSKIQYRFSQSLYLQNNHTLMARANTDVVTVGERHKLLRHSPLESLIHAPQTP
ncbi:MAG: acyl-CoA thioesterase [Thiomicrorhabdus chilensis]|uniref:acyl-CoA thioesterase n=1 Tax=Thiomicrorhabdus chilensis TaxID=63656 RepID=UPI00299ED2C9|nr:acyl-CoA thioesterase [Thiomicrorhabdus chilensis]MDX1346762.1 acyl-CoA thioesterase [Thiomicrorhabdus chilensis]